MVRDSSPVEFRTYFAVEWPLQRWSLFVDETYLINGYFGESEVERLPCAAPGGSWVVISGVINPRFRVWDLGPTSTNPF